MRVGIVVKIIRGQHTVALIDEKVGRVDAIVRVPVCVGSLVEYTIERERGPYVYLTELKITDLPFALGRDDIHFWHHVLELCYYFVPVGTSAYPVFELLRFLYDVDVSAPWSMQSKKLYLFKLLTAIGLYSELPQLPQVTLYRLLGVPVQEMVHYVLDTDSEACIDTWLKACVAQHPAIQKFNTVYFLIKNGPV